MRRIAWTAAAVLATTAGPGCQTMAPQALSVLSQPAAPSAGGVDYSYGGGRAVQTFRQNPAAVHPAVLSSLDDLSIHSIKQISDGGSIVFEGLTTDRRRATVTLRPEGAGTRLGVRVGVFGDKALSRALMDRVGIRLGNLPPAAIPENPPSEPGKFPYLDRKAVSDVEMLSDQAEALDHQSPVYEVKPYVQNYPN
jgi:hypothetical protein